MKGKSAIDYYIIGNLTTTVLKVLTLTRRKVTLIPLRLMGASTLDLNHAVTSAMP